MTNEERLRKHGYSDDDIITLLDDRPQYDDIESILEFEVDFVVEL